MTRRALTFGSVSAAYERFRPGYPDEVANAILAYARSPVRTALEIGAGTGKATRLFAAQGVGVTATEPDGAMLDELRSHVDGSVTVVQASFEELRPPQAYDLVYAAAALHWTKPQRRWSRIAALLVPGGTFASFGAPTRLADDHLEAAVRAARSPWVADDDVPAPDGGAATGATLWPGPELQRSPLFTDVRQLTVARRLNIPSDDYIGLLSTISAYLQLPERDRLDAFEKVRDVLPARVEVVADVHLHLARSLGAAGSTRW